ncbi:MAG: hypothetical protein ABSD39_01005, partial [Terriglobales bacterium]
MMLRPRSAHPAWVFSSVVCCLLLSLVYFPLSKIVASSPARILPSAGKPLVNFKTPQSAKIAYTGAPDAVAALESGKANPTALASADFDADGAVDVVAGYSSKNGGVLALYKANPDAFAPTDTSLYQKAVEGNVPPTFLPNAKVFVLPESPDLIVTGDFNLDGRKDVLVAARGGSLYFLAGDGHGNFAAPQLVTTAGPVLAMAVTPAGHVAVSTDGRKGPQITILMPGSAGLSAGQTFSLPARGTSLEWGTLGGGADLAVGAGSSVVVIYNALLANPETETVSLPFQVRGLALGAFIWDRDDRTEIAVLADDGSISILQHGTLNLTPLTPAEATARRAVMARGGGQPAPDPTELGPWTIAKRLPQTVSAPAGPLSPSAFNSPHLATTSTFDLMVIDAGRSQLSILDTSGNTTSPSTDISFSGRPVAALALPQKINAGRDLVVLAEGQSAPILAPETGATTYSVTNTADEDDINACPETSSPNGTPPIVGSGATTGAGTDGKLSLREAVCEANNQAAYNVAHSAAAGNYIINVPAGTYNLSLVTGGNWPVPPCDCPNNYWDGETGELFTGSVAGESMSIVGMGTTPASTTITQTDGVDRIMEQDWNFVGNIPISLSNMTLSGGNCLRYVDGAPGDCVSGGGAVFAGGSAGSTLTITSVVMQNNNDGGTCEGFCNAPPNNIINGEGGALAYFGPTLMLSGSTFSGNTAAQAPLNGVGFGGAFLFANNYGGTASMGAQTITNSIFTNNSTGVGGALELQIGTGSAVNISGSKFTGNQAQEDTGFTKAPSSIGGAIDASVGSGGYTLTVSDSRIVGNSATDGTGFSIQSGGTATITDNWWGCNAGPGNSGCDSVYANSATATFSPYLKLSASANPNPINTNTSTTVTVDLTHDSNGGSGFSVPTGTPVSYGSPTLGTISGFPSSLTSGTASGTFAAGGSSGMGTVPVTVDNQTVTADITINQAATPPTLSISMTNSPASFTQGDPSDTYTITVTNTGQSATSGTISLSDTLPTGLSEVSFTETAHSGGGTGSDWSCSGTSCSRTSAMAAGESDTLTLTISVLYTAPIGTGSVTNSAQVSGGGASNSPTASDPTTIIGGPVSVSFNTNPSGLQVTVDSSTYTSQKVLSLTNGSTHTISVTSPQTANGVQNTWTSWSDGGAISHQITISSTTGDARSQNGAGSTKSHSPLTPTGISYTANFATTYQLTTAVSPAGAGTVTMPTSGTYYAANAPVSVSATANTFEDWSGGTFDNAAQASTTFTMPSQPATMTANFQALAPPQSTTTVITSSQNPSFTMSPNNSTTFTATVTYGGGHPVGVGTVTFSQGNNNLSCSQGNPAPLSNGQAFCTTSFTTEGDPVITA